MNRDAAVLGAKHAYATGVRHMGAGLTRLGVLPVAPPARTRRLLHWAWSLNHVHDALALVELDVPWWTYRAIDAVDAWLATRPPPIRVLEYGAGASTFWLARRASEVFAVEHDEEFAALLVDRLPVNVRLRIVPAVPSPAPVVPSLKEGHAGLDFADYAAAAGAVGGTFDLVVIDGRARSACLAHALPTLATDGLVVFDNSRRRRYRPGIAASGLVERPLRGLTPTLPYPEQTSVLFRA